MRVARPWSSSRSTTGRTSRQPSAPTRPAGTTAISDHRKRQRSGPSATTSNSPSPRTTEPVCSTSQRPPPSGVRSHEVIVMVSQKPTGPSPDHARSLPPTPTAGAAGSTCSTRVCGTHSLWAGQSVT